MKFNEYDSYLFATEGDRYICYEGSDLSGNPMAFVYQRVPQEKGEVEIPAWDFPLKGARIDEHFNLRAA